MRKLKKKEYFKQKLQENRGKPKELWKTLKSLGLPSKTSSSSKPCLKEDGELKHDSKSIARIFKDFFSNLAENLLKLLPKAPNKFNSKTVNDYYKKMKLNNKRFVLNTVTVEEVKQILLNLDPSKATGIDNISARFLRDGASILANPIKQICNLSITQGCFPDSCKSAKLKPLFKKGNKTNPEKYRPISILPVVSKIIERVVHNQIEAFLTENKILYKYQSGFRKNHSTDFCLQYINNKISKGFDSGLLTGIILIDLQKAFDTIDHNILIEKLKIIGFCDKEIKWIRSYLSNRTFQVSIDTTLSEAGCINCGVPQGSILGPLLFLLYVNDMPQSVKGHLCLYADDSCIVHQHSDINEIENSLNDDFSNICDWFLDNKLSVHFGDEKNKSNCFWIKTKIEDR